MSNKFRNIFLCFGIIAVVVMLCTFDVSYEELIENLRRAGYYLPLVLILWLFIYIINTGSWWVILRSGGDTGSLSFAKLFKFTVSGFAINYVTPVGLMGGEPYRIMELKPYVGVERATSSVVLYVMMHIFSHFVFWLSAVALYVCLYSISWEMGVVLGLISALCLFLTFIFIKGYKNGMAVACLNIGGHIPFVKKYAVRFLEKHKEKLENIDKQIALLHSQKKRTFYGSLTLEYIARIVGCLEVWLILNVLTTDVSFMNCVLVVAFSSLMANILFFMPMQLGGREGGFDLAVAGLTLSGAFGVCGALITRVRELFWIVVGLVLVKLGNNKNDKQTTS